MRRAHGDAWRADTALGAAVLDQRALHGVQHLLTARPRRQPFHGHDRPAVALARSDQTRIDRLPVHQHGAGAALALAAAFLGAGQAQVLAQDVEQALPRRALDGTRGAVDLDRKLHDSLQRERAARTSSGAIGIVSNRQPRASLTALATAAAGPSIGILPTPLAPCGPYG